jgi:hypothetical protein
MFNEGRLAFVSPLWPRWIGRFNVALRSNKQSYIEKWVSPERGLPAFPVIQSAGYSLYDQETLIGLLGRI